MIEIFDCEQNSEAWLKARLGIPTASKFAQVRAKGKEGGDSKTRKKYMLQLLGERMTGEPHEGYTNKNTDRGHAMEDDAANAYAFMRDAEPVKVGFIRNGEKGASPDRLLGVDGLLEIKTKQPDLQLEVLLAGKLPAEHVAQVQGQLWVAEREWCDFCAYWPKLPLFVVRVYRDETYIKELDEAVTKFLEEMNELETQIKQRYAA